MNSQTTTSRTASDMSSKSHSNLAETCASECAEQQEDFQQLMDEVGSSLTQYCRRRPGVAALTVFAVGFFFGWKIKPW